MSGNKYDSTKNLSESNINKNKNNSNENIKPNKPTKYNMEKQEQKHLIGIIQEMHNNMEQHEENKTDMQSKRKRKEKIIKDEDKGDPITNKYETIRFVYQNVNGLRNIKDGKWNECIETMIKLQADIVGLTETCVNWRLKNIKRQYQQQLTKVFTNNSLIVSTNSIQYDRLYLPGGTATISVGPMSSKIVKQLFDHRNMGRWTGAAYTISAESKLYIITGYRVCKETLKNDNSMSSYSQQHLILLEKGTDSPNPRQQFVEDLIDYIKSLDISIKDFLILALDANSSSDKKNEGIHEIMEKCKLIDMYTTKHNDHTEFPTHENGSKKIDFLLCTENLVPNINKVGYLHYDECFNSDHRGIYCDIDTKIFTNKTIKNTLRKRIVGTNSTNQEGDRYIKYTHKEFVKLDIFQSVNSLYNKIKKNETAQDSIVKITEQLNELDQTITTTMLEAEKSQCSKKSPALWSPEIKQGNLLVKFWKAVVCNHRKCLHRPKKFTRYYAEMNKQTRYHVWTWAETITPKSALKKSLRLYYQLINNNKELRNIHLKNKLEDINKRGSTKQKTTIRSLIQREQNRQDFTYIRNTLKTSNNIGINRIEVPSKNNPNKYETIVDPIVYKDLLIKRNIQHFGQADGTPFASDPLKTIFGYTGTTEAVQNMINNKSVHPDIKNQPKYIQDIINKLCDGNNIPEIDNTITFEDYVQGIIKWKERTTTSPSGRHLGHYKILTRLDSFLDENKTINQSMQILEVYYQMTMSVALLGTTLERWSKIATCMIEKIKGCPRIDKLRVIHLFEADYNLILKIVWARRSVWKMHNEKRIHDGQAGSRPGKRAIDVIIQKEMKYLYSTLTKTQLGTVDNDAKSCYDRMLCNLSMAISAYYGVPECYRKLQSTNLESSKYHLRTAEGDSNEYYRNTKTTPIHGTGQGSCASPALWLMTSSFIMELYEKLSYGMKMINTISKEEIKQCIEGFVDDTSLFSNTEFKCTDINILKNNLQHDITQWSGLLEAASGKLEMSKCFFYLLTWTWDKRGRGKPAIINEQQQLESSIKIKSINNELTNIEQRDIKESHKTLGSFKCIDGLEDDHYQYLLHKSNKYASQVCHSKFNRRQAKIAFNMNYFPSLSYSLSGMCLNESQLNKIQQQAIGAFLQKLGYEKLFPRAVVYGPAIFGGLDIKQLYTHSMCQKLDAMLGHLNAKTSLGKSILITLGWLQTISGLSTPIMETTTSINYIQQTWFHGIKEFINQINGKIKINNFWVPKIKRIHDKIIMDEITKLSLDNNQIDIINNWRLYFQVLNLSDMTSTNGDSIQSQFLEKKSIRQFTSNSKINWPNQNPPDLKYFKLWTTAIKAISNCSNTGKLKKKMGCWIQNLHLYNTYKTIINESGNEIRVKNPQNTKWDIYRLSNEKWGHTTYNYNNTIKWNEYKIDSYIPINGVITTYSNIIIKNKDRQKITKNQVYLSINTYTSVKQQFQANTLWYGPLLHSTQITNDINPTPTNNIYSICCDGGVKNEVAGIGIVLQMNNHIILTNKVKIPKTFNGLNSYRAEGCGLITALATYIEWQKYYRGENTTEDNGDEATIYCDNKSIVDKTNKIKNVWTMTTKYFNSPDADILTSISILLTNARKKFGKITIKHIKGHQDRKGNNLSNEATLNILADKCATEAMDCRKTTYIVQPSTQATIFINDLQVTAKRFHLVSQTYQSTHLHQYFKLSNGWSDKSINDIWWNVHGKALNKFSSSNQTSLKKFIHKRLPTNSKENRYYPYKSPFCASCKTEIETSYHMLRCNTCPKRKEERTNYVKSIRYQMEELRTDPGLTRIIVAYVEAWIQDKTPPALITLIDNPSKELKDAITSQQKIGWDNWLKGRISIKWASQYNHSLYTTDHGLKNTTAESWGIKIIIATFNYILNTWSIRNNIEHSLEDNPNQTIILKSSKKILWHIEQLKMVGVNIYETMDENTLLNLPMSNIKIMETQLESLFKKKKENKKKDGINEVESSLQ